MTSTYTTLLRQLCITEDDDENLRRLSQVRTLTHSSTQTNNQNNIAYKESSGIHPSTLVDMCLFGELGE